MDEAKISRWGLLTGVAFAVVVVISSLIGGSPPMASDSDQKIVDHLVDNQDALKIGAYLGGLGGVLFLWFLGSLYGRLRTAEGATGRLSRVAMMAGVTTTATAFAANALASSATLRPNPGAYRVANQLYGYTTFAIAVLVAAVSVVIWSTGLLPKWFGYAGEVLAVLLFVGAAVVSTESDAIATVGLIAFIAFAVWIVALSLGLYRQAEA